jgi:hypothetical protein
MRSGEPPVTTRRRLKFVAVEKATNTRSVILRQVPGATVLPKGAKDGTSLLRIVPHRAIVFAPRFNSKSRARSMIATVTIRPEINSREPS